MSTLRKLSEMTDDAVFERLATAILREARLEYAALLHLGVNANGKTVKAPVDGIGFVTGANPAHMIAVHHTTCKRADLEGKWLHDPTTVKRRQGGRATKPAGDLIKTAEIVATEKERDPSLRATLVLTTNQEPPEDLVRKMHAAGLERGFDVDIWSASRLAHALDNTVTGQWVRGQFLGIEQERLSPELLKKLSLDSLDINRPIDDKSAWVSTGLDKAISLAVQEREVIFIIAESGLGKSTACFKQLDQHVAAGGFGLILTHQVVSSSVTIEQAIETTLRQLHPVLADGSGSDALSFCSGDRPLVVVVEDINKSGQASVLAEKLVKWSFLGQAEQVEKASSRRTGRERWKLLCPIWPQVVGLLSDANIKLVQRLAVVGAPLTVREGGEAVLCRAKLEGVFFSSLEAEAVSDALSNDPLLIALHEPGRRPQPELVIEQFIDTSVTRLATLRGEYSASEYRMALRLLAETMLRNRELSPSWRALVHRLDRGSDTVAMLRHLIHHREVIRLSGLPADEHLVFRHDRVRDALFSNSLAVMIRSDTLSDELIAEPYFAEITGAALLQHDIPIAVVDRVYDLNPLALFHSLRIFREPSNEMHHATLAAIERWLADGKSHESQNSHLRWEALAALSRTESSKVVGLVRRFKDHTWTAWEALFRNGDLSGGLQLCLALEPGTGASWRDRQVEHAKVRFGSRLTAAIGQFLTKPNIDDGSRVGALRLAGYLADSQLAEAIETSWKCDSERAGHLEDYLWAAARCCGANPQRFVRPMCDAWAALPDEKDDNKPSPRDSLAAHHVKWAFRKDVPASAIGYFIERAKEQNLRWPITYMLNGLDHPDAVEFVVRELAETDRRLEGTKNFSPFSISATDDWRRQQEEDGLPMSPESRGRLLGLWQSSENDKHIRSQAFRFWTATRTDDDLDVLRSVDSSDPLADSALWQRLERGDHTAVPALLLKLGSGESDRTHWWHFAHRVWCSELAQALENELTLRGASVKREWNATFGRDEQIYTLLMELPSAQAEELLLRHWDHLRFRSVFIQAALYVATPSLLRNVAQAINSCPNPKDIFLYIGMHYGIRRKGRSGVTSRSQLEALAPYLDHLAEHTIYQFWEVCNEHGWFDLRRRMFDGRTDRGTARLYLDETSIFASLDEMIANKRGHWIDHWIEDYLKSGAAAREIIATFAKWLANQKDFAALEVAARALIQIGQRKDLQILDIPFEPDGPRKALLADTTFAVMRRNLM
jgi:hypothetical protein